MAGVHLPHDGTGWNDAVINAAHTYILVTCMYMHTGGAEENAGIPYDMFFRDVAYMWSLQQ